MAKARTWNELVRKAVLADGRSLYRLGKDSGLRIAPELEQLVDIARENGALGAKLTGGGGGGSIIALCDGDTGAVVNAIRAAGFQAVPVALGADLDGA